MNQTSYYTHSAFIQYLQLVFVPCLALLGICGNIICAIVFNTKPLRRHCSSSFLSLLAVSDVLFSLDLLPGWINSCFVRSSYSGADLICKIQNYISFVASFLHIWMVLAFTAERFFAVNFPLKHMSKCTPRISHIIILIIMIPVIVFYIYPSFFASEVDLYGQCREKKSHVHYLNHINIVDTIMTMFLPFIFVSIVNILIIKKLFYSNTFRQHVFENGSSYQCRRTSYWTPYHKQSVKKIETNRPLVEKSTAPIHRKQHGSDSTGQHILAELRLTKMLLAISLTCLSLNFPSYYVRLIVFYQQTQDNFKQTQKYSTFALYRDVLLHYMSYLSYSINIFIYILCGANFRRALKRIFFRKKTNFQ
ncbi:unnamed protein product [Rotaria magnacalcarata]|uniref:G-protein coupled receptors family 1 profile domain-containing protein n=2 Tax=Rotaria magnacalcarata TaxID=392030 RepID=A0A816YNT2_9BILA|nr:unnamed protein product [Rotaria magnacalcarata]CAF1653923.1 unnamed protein product [Rotaria magnacalcarata]CAF2163749.1 unnamed protein product [Rotaria magnacalcarata]CAF3946609.1 unnamed protein product [Rotaria magnacalcarata]CAF3981645.1 unnamed protein product [Rotaria magnacalcarata]